MKNLKKLFIESITLIENDIKRSDRIHSFFRAEYPNSDFMDIGGTISDMTSIYHDQISKILANYFKEAEYVHDWIGYYLYEFANKPESRKVTMDNGDKVYILDTVEKLYNFLISEYKLKE